MLRLNAGANFAVRFPLPTKDLVENTQEYYKIYSIFLTVELYGSYCS